VNGGAIAVGHPLGATGLRMLTDLMYEMQRRHVRYGCTSRASAAARARRSSFAMRRNHETRLLFWRPIDRSRGQTRQRSPLRGGHRGGHDGAGIAIDLLRKTDCEVICSMCRPKP